MACCSQDSLPCISRPCLAGSRYAIRSTLPFLHIPFYFVISNLAAMWGFIEYLRGERRITWTTVR